MNQNNYLVVVLALIIVAILLLFTGVVDRVFPPPQVKSQTVIPKSTAFPTPMPTYGKIIERKGPYHIGSPTTQKIFVDVIFDNSPNSSPKTIWGFSIVSENGVVLYYEELEYYYFSGAAEIPLPNKKGALLHLVFIFMNAVECSGERSIFYCFRQDGSFGPVTGNVATCDSGHNTEIIDYKMKEESRYCYVGYQDSGNFNVVFYFPVNLNGVKDTDEHPEFIQMEEHPVSIDEAKAAKKRQEGIVHLYKAALLKGETKVLKIRRDSKVKFLGAKYITPEDASKINNPNVGWWLHVIIDGEEGYIYNRKELIILGLEFRPQDDGDSL
jgi:hypothetical protein